MTENNPQFEERTDFTAFAEKINAVRDVISSVIVGQKEVTDLLLIALLSRGHVLIEGVPGVAKTLIANLIAKTIHTRFQRIQFTPDLMPADILGTSIYNEHKGTFEFQKGPVFSNIILIDEINRSPAKTQSALFEVMEEQKITVEGNTYPMSFPFFVAGTQNPIEHEGTYRLPEAQTDRFLFRIKIGFPNIEEEEAILKRFNKEDYKDKLEQIKPVMDTNELKSICQTIDNVHVEPPLFNYMARIVHETRNSPHIFLGASPRASLAILKASKALAALQGRDFITPEDIQYITPHALNHRIIPSPEKEIEGVTTEEIISSIMHNIQIPQ